MDFEESSFHKNSQIFALSWVKRKAAKKVPEQIKLTPDELEVLIDKKQEQLDLESTSQELEDKENVKSVKALTSCDNNDATSNDDDDLKEFGFDNYDNEDDNPIMDGLPSLLVYASNDDDPYLHKTENKQEESDDESEDLNLVDSDNLLVCAHCERNYAQLNIYVYNDVTSDFYIHHDVPLPSAPLCLQWLDFGPNTTPGDGDLGNQGNFMAVGNLDSVIAVWDLDVVNTFEPSFTLGATKKKHKILLLEGREDFGHTDAVLDLSWTSLARNKLASASADHLVALWDLEKLKISQKLKLHNAKVQTISWQPNSTNCILSGTFDGSVYALDTRAPSGGNVKWSLQNEIERVAWNNSRSEYFAASDNLGTIYHCDVRKPGKELFSFKAHDDAIPALFLTSSSLYSGSSDGFVKIWEVNDDSAELKKDKTLNMGSVHCFQFNPDVPNLLAFGGQKNGVKLWNQETDKQKMPNDVTIDDRDAIKGVNEAKNFEKSSKKHNKTAKLSNNTHATKKRKKTKNNVKKSSQFNKNKNN